MPDDPWYNGGYRLPHAQAGKAFQLIAQVVHGTPGDSAEVEPRAGGYLVRVRDFEIEVELESGDGSV